jgi:hypothetical protein
MIPFILIGLSIACYSCSQLSQHGKLRWGFNNPDSFFHPGSWKRKYKMPLEPAPNNFYYRFFKIVHKERWPTSATLTVNLTDFYHCCQSLSFITLSLGISLLSGISFWFIWGGILVVHATVYRLLQR